MDTIKALRTLFSYGYKFVVDLGSLIVGVTSLVVYSKRVWAVSPLLLALLFVVVVALGASVFVGLRNRLRFNKAAIEVGTSTDTPRPTSVDERLPTNKQLTMWLEALLSEAHQWARDVRIGPFSVTVSSDRASTSRSATLSYVSKWRGGSASSTLGYVTAEVSSSSIDGAGHFVDKEGWNRHFFQRYPKWRDAVLEAAKACNLDDGSTYQLTFEDGYNLDEKIMTLTVYYKNRQGLGDTDIFFFDGNVLQRLTIGKPTKRLTI